ncbi:hypothetical protein [Pedobacter nyackensis]|uniref:Crp/Fnr family transcriptional regulator n=1 Tax=Pedobacter nyackensis TaxID=475255 RepID=UPI00292E5A03|nr:hypothetical protein [Pedobacter nyackensis]
MIAYGNESKSVRLEKIIKQEIAPKLEALAGPFTEKCIEYIISNSKLKQVAKDQYIEDNGSYEDGHLIYLYSGIAGSFYCPDLSSKTVVTRLWKKDEIMVDVNSFISKEDRIESIQMLEDGEIISIGYYQLKAAINEFPELHKLFPYLLIEREKYYIFYHHLLKLTVEERVNLFLKHNPTLINRINKDAIAQHLGMSRCRFSTAYSQYKLNKYN